MALIRAFGLSVLVLTMVLYVNSSIDSEDGFKVEVQYIGNVEESLPLETSYEKFEKADIDCLIWDKKCTKVLASIKRTILNGLKNGCVYCEEEEKRIAGKAMATLLIRQPQIWKLFLKKYDVNDTFKKLYFP